MKIKIDKPGGKAFVMRQLKSRSAPVAPAVEGEKMILELIRPRSHCVCHVFSRHFPVNTKNVLGILSPPRGERHGFLAFFTFGVLMTD